MIQKLPKLFLSTNTNKLKTATNNSGGIQGGISNGEDIVLRVGFKPTATIRKSQKTVDEDGNATTLEAKGRHDPCVLPRAVPMVEAMPDDHPVITTPTPVAYLSG